MILTSQNIIFILKVESPQSIHPYIYHFKGNVSLTNLKVVLSTPFGVLVLATCIHNLSLLLQNDDEAQRVSDIWYKKNIKLNKNV